MEQKNNFRVVIGGSGLTGLALANMLQLYGIDFVLLEAKPEIIPKEGTGSTLLPHATRILDQLGLHGYPILCLDIQGLLQTLYDNIQDKRNIITEKEIQHIRVSKGGVIVRTADGSSYNCDVIVGTDGSESTIKDEMLRIGNEVSPGRFSDEQNRASEPCEGVELGIRTSVLGDHGTLIVDCGPEGRLHWHSFIKLGSLTGKIKGPYLSEKARKEALRIIGHDKITPDISFQQVLDRTILSTATSSKDYVSGTDFHQRIITIGEVAHKMLPITGFGEGACIEFGAILANALRDIQISSRGRKPTLVQIEHSLAAAKIDCLEKLKQLKEHVPGHEQSYGFATPLYRFAPLQVPQAVIDDSMIYSLSHIIQLAEGLHDAKPASRPRLVPYKDELLRAPKASGIQKWYWIAIYVLIAGICYHGMWVQPGWFGLWEHLSTILETGEFPYSSGFPLKRVYTGNKTIDNIFIYLAAVFMSGLKDWNPSFRFLNLYFEGSLVQHLAVWTTEAYRRGNQYTLLAIVPVWFALSQFAGTGIYMPLYYAVYTFVSAPESYWWPLYREVPLKYAQSLLWAVLVGFGLPTVALFVRWEDPFTLQNVNAIWQLSPVYVPLLCTTLAYLDPYPKTRPNQWSQEQLGIMPDIRHLKRLYLITGIIGLIFHVSCFVKVILDPILTLFSVFLPDFAPGQRSLGEAVKYMFLIDIWAMDVATYIWTCQAVWDLKRVGRTDANVLKAVALIAAGNVILGPGATLCAVWYWREDQLARLNFK
ncbi:hypothetical protein N5P37_011769 [Trichoderma harzianum]|nr:hypothetical protein N5P37_011769 [Trichoderma harzianum]